MDKLVTELEEVSVRIERLSTTEPIDAIKKMMLNALYESREELMEKISTLKAERNERML